MLKVFGLENEAKWTEIVKQFKNYDVYYLPQYTKAFRLHGDGEPMLIYYEAGNTKAMNVVMKRDISQCDTFKGAVEKNTCFDIATPYGYGGFILEGERDTGILKKLDEEYCAYCLENSIVSEFVRFHPLFTDHAILEPVYEITRIGKTISMDLSSQEVILYNMNPKTRNRLRKAQSYDMKFAYGREKELFSAFKEMYDKTMDRTNAQPYYYFKQDFYDSVMNDLKDNALVFYVTLGEEIVAMALGLFCDQKIHGHLEASKTEFLRLSPVVLLIYSIALWGCENGFKTLHFGGGVGAMDDDLYKFKSNFNIHSANWFAAGKKIFNREKYDFLLDIRKKDTFNALRQGFFPEYRA